MTRLYNDPSQFADEAIDGFVAAHREWVGRVAGGVVRAVGSPAGQVAVVIGGGSGHYPAFAGLVGPGHSHICGVQDSPPPAHRKPKVCCICYWEINALYWLIEE